MEVSNINLAIDKEFHILAITDLYDELPRYAPHSNNKVVLTTQKIFSKTLTLFEMMSVQF